MADRVAIECIKRAAKELRLSDGVPTVPATYAVARGCFWLLACIASELVQEVEARDVFGEQLLGWQHVSRNSPDAGPA